MRFVLMYVSPNPQGYNSIAQFFRVNSLDCHIVLQLNAIIGWVTLQRVDTGSLRLAWSLHTSYCPCSQC